jgi:hypothetical protein
MYTAWVQDAKMEILFRFSPLGCKSKSLRVGMDLMTHCAAKSSVRQAVLSF